MDKIRQLIEQRARAWEAAKTAYEGGDEEAYTRATAEVDECSAKIETEERHQALVAELDGPAPIDPANRGEGGEGGTPGDTAEARAAKVNEAFGNWMKRGLTGLSADQRKVMEDRFNSDPEMRALAVGTDSAGGYLVPQEFENRLVEKMKWFGPMLEIANVIETASGAPTEWPTVDDTSNVGAILAENTQVSEQDIAFGTKTLGAYMYTSKLVRVPFQLLQDSAFNTEGLVVRLLGTRLGRIHNTHFTTGTGTAQPQGIVTGSTSGATAETAGGVVITTNDLISLEHSVDPAYRNGGQAWMFNDATLAALRKLKDLNGQYIWQPSLQSGVASTLFGHPYRINQDMPVPAIGVKAVLFGDFNAGYLIRRVRGVQVLRLAERYADFLQVGFLAFDRYDGIVDDSNAFRALTQAAA